MFLTLRIAGVTAALLAASAPAAAAQAIAPPSLAGTDLTSPPAADPAGARIAAARCSARAGFAAFSAAGTAANGDYVGPYGEDAAAQLGSGGLSEDFEPRPLRAAGHRFTISSPRGEVFGTQRALDVIDAGVCVKPYFDSANLYLSYATATRYAARIETTSGGVYVDRGEGFVSVDIVEALDGTLTGNTHASFEGSDGEATRLLRRRDCRRGGFLELAYASKAQCRRAAHPGT